MKLSTKIVLIVIGSLILLGGCPKESEITPTSHKIQFYFYIVTAPINKEQAELTRLFFVNAESNRKYATQIITWTNRYTVAEVCTGDKPAFPVAEQEVRNPSDVQAVVDEPKRRIEEILSKKKSCEATAKLLTSITTNLKQALERREKLVIIMQVPWRSNEIPDAVLTEFKKGMDEIAKSNNVERVVLFGVSPEGSDRLAGAFESFNQGERRFIGSTTDLKQILQKMTQIRSDVLKRK
jgi:hypothetical protein